MTRKTPEGKVDETRHDIYIHPVHNETRGQIYTLFLQVSHSMEQVSVEPVGSVHFLLFKPESGN